MAKSGSSNASSVKEENSGHDNKSKEKNKAEVKKSQNDFVCVLSKPVSTPISILIESLVKNLCTAYEPDRSKADAIYQMICDKLFEMRLIDESYQMDEFEGMRSQYQKAFFHLLKTAIGDEKLEKRLHLQPAWPNIDETQSHYYGEFEELEYIAGGGFGHVYRVRHKLDGTVYAVKKILLRAEGIMNVKSYLTEAKTFSSMNHPNVVQYKGAWLELGVPNDDPLMIEETCSSTVETTPKIEHIDDEYIYHKDITDSFSSKETDDKSDFEVDFEHSINGINSRAVTDAHSFSLGSLKKSRRRKRDSISEGGMTVFTIDYREIEKLKTKQKRTAKWATLYIQMSFCQTTLKDWLEHRNNAEIPSIPTENALLPVKNRARDDAIYSILTQILKGLEYIHMKGVVHHDVKPSNIFIQSENGSLLIQLGDFGLACPAQNVQHCLAMGTKLYAAPEQLNGKCHPKSDMYSVGIVLYELLERFRTDMERVKYITQLRKGHIPHHLHIQQPQYAQVISDLVTKPCEERPDATSLLKTLTYNKAESEEMQALKSQLKEKDEEIARLKALLEDYQEKCIH